MDSTKHGMVDFIGRIVRQLDHQYTSDHAPAHSFYPSMISVAHDPHGMFSHPGGMSRMHLAHSRAHFSSKSVPTTCPRCKHEIMTLVRRRPNALNIAASASALVAGLVFKLPPTLLPLAMLPLQVKALQPKIHYCPRCNYKLGKNVKITVPLEY
ncbi:hypothetical protein IWW51_002204 [Coemansia sp. RSA 2702]|nr:hypothetical protein IWW51_002204 [Coemansia sp. RSA 2702]